MTDDRTVVRTYPEGVTCWIDTEQPDLEAAKRFYGGLFGWTFTTATPPEAPAQYIIAQLDGQDVAGLGSGEPGAEPGRTWNTYVAVDDADATARRVTAAGGTVLTAPADAGPGGRDAVCADPSGAQFRLWQARRRPGAQVTNVPGAWNFSDLHGPGDAGGDAGFYTEVFGWSFDDVGFATMLRVPGYGDHLEATVDPDIRSRQAGAVVPPGFADAIGWLVPAETGAAHWQVTFTVADRDASAATAERLGATVRAGEESEWTRTALVRDPQGAEFTISQFTPAELTALDQVREPSIQERLYPELPCFGCGHGKGLRLRSYPATDPAEEGVVVATFTPWPEHNNGLGYLNGGIISTVLDCHSAAAVTLCAERHGWPALAGAALPYVTAGLDVRFLRPAPLHETVELRAVVIEAGEAQIRAEVELVWDGKPRARAEALWKRWRPR